MPATLFHKITESFAGSLYVGRSGPTLLYLQQVALRSTTPTPLVDAMVQVLDDMRYLSGNTIAAPSQVVKFMGQIGVVTPFFEAVPLRMLQSAAREKGIPFPVRVATKIALDVFDGLCQYHALDTKLYGGICPDHLLVGTDGDTRVGNIPVSAITPKESPWRGRVERLAYLAPEQVTSAQGFDARTDVYTIGLILWEMIANQPRLSGTPLQILEMLRAFKGVPDLAPLDASKVSKGLLASLARALSPNPADRQPSVGAFALDLLEADEEPASSSDVAEYVEQVAKETLQPLRTAVAVQEIEAIKESRAPKSEGAAVKASAQVVEAEQLLAAVREARPPSLPPPNVDRTEVFNVTAELLERARRGPQKNTAAAAAVTVPRPRKPTPIAIEMELVSDKTVSFEVPNDLLEEARRLFVTTEKAPEVTDSEFEDRPSRGGRGASRAGNPEEAARFPQEPTTDQRRAAEFLKQLRSNAPGPSHSTSPAPTKVEDDVTTIWRPERPSDDPYSQPAANHERERTPHSHKRAEINEDSASRSPLVTSPGAQEQGLPNPSIAPNRWVYWLLGLVVSAIVGAITVYASRFLAHWR